jgi:hypothetical protein
MRKTVLPVFALVLINVFAKAQQTGKLSLSFGPEIDIPLKTTSPDGYYISNNYYKAGYSGSLKAEWALLPSLHITGSAGYVSYGAKYQSVVVPNYYNTYPGPFLSGGAFQTGGVPYKFIPLKAGLQYYFVKYLYVDAEAGDAIKANHTATSSFIYSGGFGSAAPLSKNSSLDFGVRFERGYKILDYPYPMEQIGIRLAYKYRF